MTQGAVPGESPVEGGQVPAKGSARVTPAASPPASQVYGSKPAPGRAQVPLVSSPPSPSGRAQVPLDSLLQPAAPAARRRGWNQLLGGRLRRASRRQRLLLGVILPVFLFVAALGSGSALQMRRTLPTATLVTELAATMRIPGAAVTLPWPDQGSAEVMVEGLGRLGGSNSDQPAPIGSVAKVMTAYLILKKHPLQGDEEGPTLRVTQADVADFEQRKRTNQSQVVVRAGEELTERDALEALLLPSANNIAKMLAVWDAGFESAFVDDMNAAAGELGMKATTYTDPSGYLPTTTSTAADQVTLARAALKFDVFADLVALEKATIPVAGTVANYNDLLGELGVFGIKTGSTNEAGGNLLFAARLTAGTRSLTVVGAVFNQPGAHTTEQLAKVNTEVRRLLRAVRGTVREYTLVDARPIGTLRTAWETTAPVAPATPLKVVGWPGMAVPVQVIPAPGAEAAAGAVVGSVRAAGVRVELTTTAATAPPSVWWRLTRLP